MIDIGNGCLSQAQSSLQKRQLTQCLPAVFMGNIQGTFYIFNFLLNGSTFFFKIATALCWCLGQAIQDRIQNKKN